MAKHSRASTRVDTHLRASSNSTRCPVEAIATQIEGLWVELERIEKLPDQMTISERDHQQRRLFDAGCTLRDLASLTRAQSIGGALFQIGLAREGMMELRNNVLDEDRHIELADQIDRLLYSAAGVIGQQVDGGSPCRRYLPSAEDPLAIFDRARSVA